MHKWQISHHWSNKQFIQSTLEATTITKKSLISRHWPNKQFSQKAQTPNSTAKKVTWKTHKNQNRCRRKHNGKTNELGSDTSQGNNLRIQQLNAKTDSDIEPIINDLVQRDIYSTASGNMENEDDFTFNAQEFMEFDSTDATPDNVGTQVEQKVANRPNNFPEKEGT